MMLQCVFRSSCICLLLFSFGACAPARKGQIPSQSGSGTGSGSSGGDSFALGTGSSFAVGGAFSGVGAGSYVGSKAGQDAGLSQMIADLLCLSPYGSRPLLQFHWSSPQVPKGMAATRPVFPSSLIVHSDGGYQRARDFCTDSKYTQDIFHHIPKPGTPQTPESGSKKNTFSTSLECEQLWFLLHSEARDEMAAHQRTPPQMGSVVGGHLDLGC